MSRPTHHHAGRHGALGAALLRAMDADLGEMRATLDKLASEVEARRAAGLDVAADEQRLGALIARVGGMSAEADRLATGGSR